jgi:hypothetical protein
MRFRRWWEGGTPGACTEALHTHSPHILPSACLPWGWPWVVSFGKPVSLKFPWVLWPVLANYITWGPDAYDWPLTLWSLELIPVSVDLNLFRAGVESSCLHGPNNWLMRQQIDSWDKVGTQSRIYSRKKSLLEQCRGALLRWRLGLFMDALTLG